MEKPLGKIESRREKPLLTAEEQIAHLKAKGVTFDCCDETVAADFLRGGNNYLRTASYRKLYPKQMEGEHVGSYVNLDFGDLVAIASLDRQLRETFLALSIDVEHFAKMKVLANTETRGEDGYAIVADFYASLNHAERNALRGALDRRSRADEGRDTYAGDLIARYQEAMPAWVLVEVLDFGTFLTFYKFCAERWEDAAMLQEHYVLKSVKALRNATAHNHCIINGFVQTAETASYPTNELITDALNAAGLRRTKGRRAKLSNLRIAQMAATLYAASTLFTRESTVKRHAKRLAALRRSYEANLERYRLNSSLVSFFDFLWKLVDIWLPDTREYT